MTDTPGAPSATEYTKDWQQFEDRLASVLGQLAAPSLTDTIRLRFTTAAEAAAEVFIQGSFSESSRGGPTPGAAKQVVVQVTLPDGSSCFYPLHHNGENIPEAASHICTFLRDIGLLPHPSLLTAEAERIAGTVVNQLGLPSPDGVVREVEGLHRPDRRRAKWRGDPDRDGERRGGRSEEPSQLAVSWPRSVDETREAIEQVLHTKYGIAESDSDDDYIVYTSTEGGRRFYLTVINDRPVIAFRKTVIPFVKSRQAALIEANFLNRENLDIRWVLRDETLSQEYSFSTDPFVSARFVQMLDLFGQQYLETISALQMRLEAD